MKYQPLTVALTVNPKTNYYAMRIYPPELPTFGEEDTIIRSYTAESVEEYLLAVNELWNLQTKLNKGE